MFIGKMFIVGSIQGPLHHYFYAWMDNAMKLVSVANVTKKILLDQVVLSPVIILAFLYPAGWLNDQSTKECNEEVVAKFGKIYAVSLHFRFCLNCCFIDRSFFVHRLTGFCGPHHNL